MRRLALLAALLLSSGVHAQQYRIVTSCGSMSPFGAQTPGSQGFPTMDVNGRTCLTSAGSVTFFGTLSTTPAITAGISTVVPIDTVVIDTASGWSTGTNTYTGKAPGNYRICAHVSHSSTIAGGPLNNFVLIKKNSTQIASDVWGVPTGTTQYVSQYVCAVATLNGTTDTLSAYIQPNAAATTPRLYSATSIEVTRVP
jgi:hypothetical protein